MRAVDCPTYTAVITVGMREGYGGPVHHEGEVETICQEYCDEVGLGLELHFGQCVYTGGREPSARISLINYPRFPKMPSDIFEYAERLGRRLAKHLKQLRFTVVATDRTRMYEL